METEAAGAGDLGQRGEIKRPVARQAADPSRPKLRNDAEALQQREDSD